MRCPSGHFIYSHKHGMWLGDLNPGERSSTFVSLKKFCSHSCATSTLMRQPSQFPGVFVLITRLYLAKVVFCWDKLFQVVWDFSCSTGKNLFQLVWFQDQLFQPASNNMLVWKGWLSWDHFFNYHGLKWLINIKQFFDQKPFNWEHFIPTEYTKSQPIQQTKNGSIQLNTTLQLLTVSTWNNQKCSIGTLTQINQNTGYGENSWFQ